MAYGLKYTLLCTTRKGNLYKAKLYFNGYTGAEIDRDVPVRPFRLRKDKASVVRGTSFEFSIRERTDFEFLEFYSNNLKNVKVEFCDSSDNVLWTGYNLPQQYQVPYTPAPTNVTFTASDGLGLLKNESFSLTGRKSQMEIICYCIDKIGLDLGYSIAITLFESQFTEDRSPLEQTYENTSIFSELNCYEVIENILKKYNAEITQCRGRWAITRKADKKSTRMLYTHEGVYDTTEAAPATLNMGKMGDSGVVVWPRGSLQLSIEPGAKQVRIRHAYGSKGSYFTNPAFGWDVDGVFTPECRFNSNGAYAFLPGKNNTEQWIYKTIAIDNATGMDFVFSVKSAAMGSKSYGGLRVSVPMAVTFKVILTDGVDTYYLTEAGWTETASSITKITASRPSGDPKFNELTIVTPEIPISGNMTVYLGRYHSMHEINDSAWDVPGIAWADVNAAFIEDGQLAVNGLDVLASFTNSTEPGILPDQVLISGDAPADIPNSDLLFDNITYRADGSVTTGWKSLLLYLMLAYDLASDNRVGKQKLTGEIKGTGINFDSIISDVYSSRDFEISEGTWEVYDEVFSVTLLELLAWSNENVTFTNITGEGSTSSSPSTSSAGLQTGTILMTGAQILAELLESDGTGSGLDADLLDGNHATAFSLTGHNHNDLYPGIATYNNSDWDEAHSWGDWASNFGTTTGTITQGNDSRVLNGQTAFGWGNHANGGYAVKASNETITGNWTFDSVTDPCIIMKNDVRWEEGMWAIFGTSDESYISYGSGGSLIFNLTAHNKFFHFRGEDAVGTLRDVIKAYPNSAVELYYNGSKKIETTNTGASTIGTHIATGDIIAYST
jgi:hypothetical protein